MDTFDLADLVLQDAEVVDGSGAFSYRADVAVKGGRIVAVVQEAAAAGCQRPRAMRELDAEGLTLCPGFVDLHAHSDLTLLHDPGHSAKVGRGVTFEVLGQDGLSYAPVDDRTLGEVRRAIAAGRHRAEGGVEDVEGGVGWRSVGAYLDRLDHGFGGEGIALDAAYLVPQGTVRALVMGGEDREATRQELDTMRELVAEGMRQGAFGMSSGPTCPPGMRPRADELAELCRVVADHGGYYCPSRPGDDAGADALTVYEEMIAAARKAGCPLHLPDDAADLCEDAGLGEGTGLGEDADRSPELPLEERVARLTSRPAALLGLTDRGLVREGYRADLVLLAPGTPATGPTHKASPHRVVYVLIDGRFVIEEGRRTDVLAGRAVRRVREEPA